MRVCRYSTVPEGARKSAITSMTGAASSEHERRRTDVERTLRPAAVSPLSHVQQTDEPRRVEARDGDPPKNVLEEAREADDPEAGARHVQQPVDGRLALDPVRHHDHVGLQCRDHVLQSFEATEHRHVAADDLLGAVGYDAEDVERRVFV